MTTSAIPAYVRRLSRTRDGIRNITLPKSIVDAWEGRYGLIEKVEIHINGEDIVLRPSLSKGQESLDAAE